jgi:hypothetical protein
VVFVFESEHGLVARATLLQNPFDPITDSDRHIIWRMLIADDSEAFIAGDFTRVESDFDEQNFEGIRCDMSGNPADWTIAFPDLASYRASWLDSARKFGALKFRDLTPLDALYFRCSLSRIDIAGDRALAHKKFSGSLLLADGSTYAPGARQTLYRLHRQQSRWKIVGFLGQLPL